MGSRRPECLVVQARKTENIEPDNVELNNSFIVTF